MSFGIKEDRYVQALIDSRFVQWQMPSSHHPAARTLPTPPPAKPWPAFAIIADPDPVRSWCLSKSALMRAGVDGAMAEDILLADQRGRELNKLAHKVAAERERIRLSVRSVTPSRALLEREMTP
jgi:hypothetical protein